MPFLSLSTISSICFFSEIKGGAIIKQSPVALKVHAVFIAMFIDLETSLWQVYLIF